MILSTLPGSRLAALAIIGAGLPAMEARRVVALSNVCAMVKAERTPRQVAAYVYSLGPCVGSDVQRALCDAAAPESFASAVLDILGDEPWFA